MADKIYFDDNYDVDRSTFIEKVRDSLDSYVLSGRYSKK
jgi:hypothetical protein